MFVQNLIFANFKSRSQLLVVSKWRAQNTSMLRTRYFLGLGTSKLSYTFCGTSAKTKYFILYGWLCLQTLFSAKLDIIVFFMVSTKRRCLTVVSSFFRRTLFSTYFFSALLILQSLPLLRLLFCLYFSLLVCRIVVVHLLTHTHAMQKSIQFS